MKNSRELSGLQCRHPRIPTRRLGNRIFKEQGDLWQGLGCNHMLRHTVWGLVVRMGSVLPVLDLVPVGLVQENLVQEGLDHLAPDLNLVVPAGPGFVVRVRK